jgi:Family of unknown function (DUF6345)
MTLEDPSKEDPASQPSERLRACVDRGGRQADEGMGGRVNQLGVGAIWCTFFRRPGAFSWIFNRALENAYRSPTYFLSVLRDAGTRIEVLRCDEAATADELNGTSRKIDEGLDLIYVATHGKFTSEGYKVLFTEHDWFPSSSLSARVGVFDTCELIKSPGDPHEWTHEGLDRNVRIILGFDGPATMAQGIRRGEAFAKLLVEGSPICLAWLEAVEETSPHVYDKAIAVSLGDDESDARDVFDTATLHDLPPPRANNEASMYWNL